ncbi:cytochrome b561 [Idiomarina aquatica]|uniref:Cytochrome b561 n=1 Tax=Idiomarina aquatica TaxID=1327752 RepID=A0A4R6PL19_9GAMM|nr:cytochrome b [Idiomarina aquatica]TDP39161.1 cytochrome b561 [Idiomarina aquatica]
MTNRFSLTMRIMHWAMAALLISMLAAGLLMVRSLEPWQLSLLTIHKGFGVVAAVLVVVRLVIRLAFSVPPLPQGLSRLQASVAKLSHGLLYALMVLMPISGYLMQYLAGRPVEVFGLFRLPAALSVDIEGYAIFREMHGWLAIVLIALVIMHVGAALHHHFIRKDDVLKSML